MQLSEAIKVSCGIALFLQKEKTIIDNYLIYHW